MGLSTKTRYYLLCFSACVCIVSGFIMTMYGFIHEPTKDPDCEWFCNLDETVLLSQLKSWGPILLVFGVVFTAAAFWYYKRRLLPLQDYHSRQQQTYAVVQQQQIGATAPPASYPSIPGGNYPQQSGYPPPTTQPGYYPAGAYLPPGQYPSPPPGQYPPPPHQYPLQQQTPTQHPNYQQNATVLGMANTLPPPAYSEISGAK
ncbi:uncharacterized protein [Clytia hemisphaerica]|uniref:uncharacterized protein n=1 Tax=Clytia hemisphaerica TaxID=252671 RepID=UPI0034D42C34